MYKENRTVGVDQLKSLYCDLLKNLIVHVIVTLHS